MSELAPPPPPPPPIISPAPPSDDEDDENVTTESSEESETDSDATPIPSSVPVPPPPPPPPVAPSEPVTSADMVADEAPAPVKDDRKLWERPWSLKELKNATECWTLAADAGLLLFMKEFSQKVVSKTHEIEKQVDSLIHEAKNTDTRAGNIFNDFMMLSNIQFVENRVYEENEDEDEEKKEKAEAEQIQSEERPAEEKQMEMVSRIREAVSCGLKVLDEAFTKLEVEDEASSDEDETIASYQEPILEAKDPYALRPMPYLIGTSGFFESDDVGIGEFGSEGEEEEEEEEYSTDEEEESQARQPTRGVMEDDSSEEELFEPSDKESEEGDKRGGVAEPFSSGSSSDEGSSSAGEFSSSEDDDKVASKPAMVAPVQMDLQAELAAKLGLPSAAPVTTATGEGSEFESSIAPSESVSAVGGEKHGKKKRKKKKKHKDKGLTEDVHGKSASKSKEAGLFMPEENEDEGTPFGQDDNIFGTSKTAKGLFDESDDEEKESSGVFAAAVSRKKSNEEPSEDADIESLHSSMSKSSKKKLPAGAVPMFGAPPGLFTPEEEKSVTFDDISTVKSEGSPLTAKKKDGSSLFDDEDDDAEGGLFRTKKKSSSGSKASPTTAPKPRRHKSSTSSDVFDDKESSGLFSSGQRQEGAAGSPARKKKPVGGVSIFGPQPSFLTESLKSKSSFAEDDSEPPGFTAEDSSVVSQPITSTAPIKTAHAPTTTTSSSAGLGLFDDSGGEEDLFTTLATQKSKPKGKAPVGGVSIFGAITDELTGGTTSTEPEPSTITTAPAMAPTKSVTSTVTSKKSGGLFSDGTESDEDGLFSTKPTTKAAPKTSTEVAKPSTTSSKDPFGIGSDEEDNFFTSAPAVSKPPPSSTQPVKVEEPKVATKPKTKASKDIFDVSDDDADNLFASALTSKPKSVEKKPVKTEQKTAGNAPAVKKKPVARLGGLFDNDEDDDELFGSSNFGFGLGTSKPSTTKTSEPAKPSKPGLDLLSDTPSEEDGLFTTKPTSTARQPKASVPPPTSPKTKQMAATDDLFTASIDSGNVGGEPPQSSPDVLTEPAKPQKKKPAGAVPMFGGVDLFGGGGLGNKDTIPVTTAAPSVEEKQETMPTAAAPTETKKSVGGLFGSPTSEDDDDMFSFKPKKAPVKTPVKEPQPQQQDDVFATVKPSKLKSTVSFEAPAMKSPPTKAPVMEKSVSFEEPQKSDTLTNFTKNRAVRQGGRRPPSRQTVKAQSGQSDDAIAGFTGYTPSSTQQNPSKRLDADPLGFGGTGSQPDTVDDLFTASSTVLPPAGSSRTTTKKAKKPVPRPAATKEKTDITKDILFGNDDMLAESPPKETATIVDQTRVTEIEKQIQKEIQEDDDLFGTKALSKNLTSTIGDDLFGTSTPTKSTVTTTTSVASKNAPPAHKLDDDDDDDDLFPSDNKNKPVQPSAAAATATTTTTTTTTIPNKDTTDAPPPPPPTHKVDGDEDELFPSDDKKKPKKEKTVVKKKKAAVTDEDLFGDTDDIFGNVPKDTSKPATGKSTKAKTGKGKKKKKASSAKATAAEVTATATTEPVTDVHDGVTPAAKLEPSTTETSAPTKHNDFEDSLFGETAENAKKAKVMKKKAKKKSEPKDYSMFDTDAPSIFDDPLNADN